MIFTHFIFDISRQQMLDFPFDVNLSGLKVAVKGCEIRRGILLLHPGVARVLGGSIPERKEHGILIF